MQAPIALECVKCHTAAKLHFSNKKWYIYIYIYIYITSIPCFKNVEDMHGYQKGENSGGNTYAEDVCFHAKWVTAMQIWGIW